MYVTLLIRWVAFFLVEVGRGELVCIAEGLCKGVPGMVEFVGVEER
jgi:hypothetical protein